MFKISIIIPYFTPFDYMEECLNALHANTFYPIHEVVIINDGAPDGERLREFLPTVESRLKFKVRFIDRVENKGFVYTCNEGADAAKGEWLLFLNFDTIPQRGWLSAMTRCLKAFPNTGVLGANLLYPGINLTQHVGGAFSMEGKPVHIYRGAPAFLPFLKKDRELQWVTGAAFLVKKNDFHKVSGFDSVYGSSSEDLDFCFKMRFRLGKEARVAGDSVVYHHSNVTGITTRNIDRTHRLFFERWGDRIFKDEDRIYESDGFSSAFIRLLERSGINDLFGGACLLMDLLELDGPEDQAAYVKSKGAKGLQEDISSLAPGLFLPAGDLPGLGSGSSYHRNAVQKIIRTLGQPGLSFEAKESYYRQLLDRLDSMNLFTILYNVASLMVNREENESARNLFMFLSEFAGPLDPSLAGKSFYKLAGLSEELLLKKDYLNRCLELYPGHKDARRQLETITKT